MNYAILKDSSEGHVRVDSASTEAEANEKAAAVEGYVVPQAVIADAIAKAAAVAEWCAA